MRAWIYLIGLLTLCGARLVAAATWQSCHLSGHGDALRCTAMAVPRDYADAAKGSIDLHIALAPAVRAQAEPDPVFVLAGGPGQAGSDIVMLLDTALAKARASRDIVFIDPRGTGRSGRLNCDDGSDPLTRGDEALRDATLACLRGFSESLLTYSTESAAEDLDRVRIALGAERINLWGGSYGTRLAQVYAQRHPAQVRSLILDGVVDADLIIGADDLAFQAALDALLQRCAGDADCARAFPSLANDLDALLRNLDAAAATATLPHPRSGRPVAAPVSRLRLLQTIKHLLYSPRSAARVPYLIARARAGDWRPLLAVQASSVDVAIAPPAGGLLMTIACREDWPRLDASRRAEQANSRTFGGRSLAEFDAICGALALPAVALPASRPLPIPALLLSGTLDPVTPPSRAERVLPVLPRAQHIVVRNAGHIVSGTGCAPSLLRRFLDAPTQPVDPACLADNPVPAFQTDTAGAAP